MNIINNESDVEDTIFLNGSSGLITEQKILTTPLKITIDIETYYVLNINLNEKNNFIFYIAVNDNRSSLNFSINGKVKLI